MNIYQDREQKEIVKELEEELENKKIDLYILENYVEFKTKKDGKLFKNFTRNFGDTMKIEYGFINPTEISYIDVKGNHKEKFRYVRLYYTTESENLTDAEKIELIKKLIEDRKKELKNQIKQQSEELSTISERLSKITQLVNEFNEKLNTENLVTNMDRYQIEDYIKNNIKIKRR